MAMERIKYISVVTRIASGFQTGYHHVKVNVENKTKSPVPVIGLLYMCARGFDNGSTAISISFFGTSNGGFCTFMLNMEPVYLSFCD